MNDCGFVVFIKEEHLKTLYKQTFKSLTIKWRSLSHARKKEYLRKAQHYSKLVKALNSDPIDLLDESSDEESNDPE